MADVRGASGSPSLANFAGNTHTPSTPVYVDLSSGALWVVVAETPTKANVGTADTLTTARTISITGDLAYTSGAFNGSANVTGAGTLATVNSNVGTFGSATKAGIFTVSGKGLITAASESTVTPAVGSITGLGSNVAAFLATPSSANLASALTDEVGSGLAVFQSTLTAWTPVLTNTVVGDLSVSYSQQVGAYLKTGNEYQIWFRIVTSAFTWTTTSGEWEITGLPGASNSTTGLRTVCPLIFSGFTRAGYTAIGLIIENSSIINLRAQGSGNVLSLLNAADLPSGGSVVLQGACTYPA